ncbi:hypothetical protein E2C01_024103 [Portunus trituberculatus]|uniref:Uncharacterized protein n=1 Tax=Portunus trituberculatus TaxID=210409 RepID=A0A5B7EDH9_PORTR|nr:hypothetical protein [Portunus trituberculatus]
MKKEEEEVEKEPVLLGRRGTVRSNTTSSTPLHPLPHRARLTVAAAAGDIFRLILTTAVKINEAHSPLRKRECPRLGTRAAFTKILLEVVAAAAVLWFP